MALAGELIDLFGYPESSRTRSLRLCCSPRTLPLVGVNMIVGATLAAKDRQRQWAIAGVIAAAAQCRAQFRRHPVHPGPLRQRCDRRRVGDVADRSVPPRCRPDPARARHPRPTNLCGSREVCRDRHGDGCAGLACERSPSLSTVPLGALFYGVGVLLFGVVPVRISSSTNSLAETQVASVRTRIWVHLPSRRTDPDHRHLNATRERHRIGQPVER